MSVTPNDDFDPGAEPAGESYTIQEGDTCGSLAKLFLKDEERWAEVFERLHAEFPDQMTSNPNVLPIGLVLA